MPSALMVDYICGYSVISMIFEAAVYRLNAGAEILNRQLHLAFRHLGGAV